MTYHRNPTDIPNGFEASAPDTVEWPSHPIARQLARGLPWLKMHMQAQTKPRKILQAMNLLKTLATEIYKVELAFIGQIMTYLLRRDTSWQARVKHDLGGDKVMQKWWRRFERVQSGEVPQKRVLSEHQRNMAYDANRNVNPKAANGPITDNEGLFRLAPITGGHRKTTVPRYRPYRATKPTSVFQPIQITPEDLGFTNPAVSESCESEAPSDRPESTLKAWFEQQTVLIQTAINTLSQTGRRVDAHLFQDWLAHLHDKQCPHIGLRGRATLIMPDAFPRE